MRGDKTLGEYAEATSLDASLQIVLQHTKNNWPKHKKLHHPIAKPYWLFRDTLCGHNGILFYGKRLITPQAKQTEMLERFHDGHQGITKTTARTHSCILARNVPTYRRPS